MNCAVQLGDASSGLSDAMDEMTQCINEQMDKSFKDWKQLLDQNATQMSERWNQWQVTLSDNARHISQSQELVSEQLHLTREVLDELAAVQNKLSELEQARKIEDAEIEENHDEKTPEPTLRVVRMDQPANRINHIYRFKPKTVDISEAA